MDRIAVTVAAALNGDRINPDAHASSSRKRIPATRTRLGPVKDYLLLQLLAVLFFLAPCNYYGFVTHRFRRDPNVQIRISPFHSVSSAASINSDNKKKSSSDNKKRSSSDNKKNTKEKKDVVEDDDSTRGANDDPKKKIPVHLLAGFLGSGKTTTLKHVLENKEDVRVGVIVNDVASVNIDAKLISRPDARSGTIEQGKSEGLVVELQNGCACCSLAGELFDSIEFLLQHKESTTTGKPAYDAILVELSGVADPLAIRNNWREAVKQQTNPLATEFSELGNVVTVVDATTFGSDYMTFDILKDRDGWFETTTGDHSVNRQVVELLAEQVEAADLIVVNKEDLAGPEKVEVTKSMAQSLNKDARVLVTSHGRIPAKELLGLSSRSRAHDCKDVDCTDSSHFHSHDYSASEDAGTGGDDCEKERSDSHSHDHTACDDPHSTDPSHSHNSSHDSSECDDVDCTDPSHDNSHSHDHTACDDPHCTDPSHSHTSSHDSSECDDVDCTDPTHDHSHSHDHHGQTMTSMANLGISSFVYKATRPFHTRRLRKLLFDWPIPIKEELDFALLNDAAKTGYGIDAEDDDEEPTTTTTTTKTAKRETTTNEGESETTSPFVGVLRSKGFCWIAPTAWEGLLADAWRHDTTMYWSHAGKHMGIQPGGRFWDSLPRSAMEDFFAASADPKASIEKILRDDFVTEEFGDRRQELVFIGVGLRQQTIEDALKNCLLTETEMNDYREQLSLLRVTLQ
jgi:G3E family GTPase